MGVSAAALDARFPQWRNKGKFSLWTLGVDTRKFSPSSSRGNKCQEKLVLISIGSFIPQRRQDLLLQIYALVLEKIPGSRLVLVGEGMCFEKCKALSQELSIYNRVDFLGLRDDIPDLLQMADIFLSCSEAEGLPNVLLEAQASGLPVVASDIPPHREALPEVAHELLFQHNNLQGAANNIIRVLNDPQLYNRLSRAGRQYMVKHYDAKKSLEKLQEMYDAWCEAHSAESMGQSGGEG